MRTRAVAILNRLKVHPELVSWNANGQVKLNGVTIQGSNISDLLRDALRKRGNFEPVGSRQFFRVLSDINIPKDLVRNEERWLQTQVPLSSDDEGGGPSYAMTPPKEKPKKIVKKSKIPIKGWTKL